MKCMRLKITLIAFLFSIKAMGQKELEHLEKQLVKSFIKIEYWSKVRSDLKGDSLLQANKRFTQQLLRATSTEPQTFNYGFPMLKELGMQIVSSSDDKLRIYSWNTQIGGTVKYFEVVYQYKTLDTMASTLLVPQKTYLDPKCYFTDIHILSEGDTTYYMGVFQKIQSTNDQYHGVQVFHIDENGLQYSAKLFETPKGLSSNFGFEFDYLSVLEFGNSEKIVKLIEYDPIQRRFILPFVHENGNITDKKIFYPYNGQYFQKLE